MRRARAPQRCCSRAGYQGSCTSVAGPANPDFFNGDRNFAGLSRRLVRGWNQCGSDLGPAGEGSTLLSTGVRCSALARLTLAAALALVLVVGISSQARATFILGSAANYRL